MNKRKDIVPNNLKEFRLKAGLTQKQVAEKMNLDCENRLCRWENGKAFPSAQNLLRLCLIYKINPTETYSVIISHKT